MPLPQFAEEVYALIETYRAILPPRFLLAFEIMTRNNWLVSYSSLEGMKHAMAGMAERASFNSKMETAHHFLEENYAALETHFSQSIHRVFS
jgi:acyl carrier protein phosphodiesterase